MADFCKRRLQKLTTDHLLTLLPMFCYRARPLWLCGKTAPWLRLAQFDEARWKDIANLVETRNHVQCLQRWKKVGGEDVVCTPRVVAQLRHGRLTTWLSKRSASISSVATKSVYYIRINFTLQGSWWSPTWSEETPNTSNDIY